MDRPPMHVLFTSSAACFFFFTPRQGAGPDTTPKVCDLNTYKPDCFAQVMTYSQMIQDCLSDLSGSVGSVSLS